MADLKCNDATIVKELATVISELRSLTKVVETTRERDHEHWLSLLGNGQEGRLPKLERKVQSLSSWRIYLTATFSTLAALALFFRDTIREWLHH